MDINDAIFEIVNDWQAGVIVSLFGVVLAGIHLYHGGEELQEELPAVIYGVVLPLLISVLIIYAGYWITRHEWINTTPYRIVGWFISGMAVGFGLIGLLLLYQAAEDVVLSDQMFVLAMFATYGGAIGLLIGRYDQLRQREQELQRGKSERLENFANIVSHDLRNPLNVAAGRLELGREEHDNEHFEAVARAHERMQELIDDLLTLARQDRAEIRLEPVNLSESAMTCWENVETGDADLQVETELRMRADGRRFRQLVENLLRNAVEHGGDDVTVRVGDREDGFFIEDDGEGIPPAEREQIFEAGYSSRPEGTGFGLSIVKRAADAHGWDVRVTESSQGGARFEFLGVKLIKS